MLRKPTRVGVQVPRGVPRGFKILYENESDEHPDYVAGDLHVMLEEKAPERGGDRVDDGVFFRRKGDDLYWHEVLSVREAWMGEWSRNLTHLDGHVVRLGRDRGQVVQPGHVDSIAGEGMPIWRGEEDEEHDYGGDEGLAFGKLYVQYTVVLPDQLDKAAEGDFRAVFDKWRLKAGVELGQTGRKAEGHDEL